MPPRRHEPSPTAAPPVPAELAAYLDSLPEPHILFDEHYRIVAANRAYRAQFAPRGKNRVGMLLAPLPPERPLSRTGE